MFTIEVFQGQHGGVKARLDLLSEPEPFKAGVLAHSFVSDEWEHEANAVSEVLSRYRTWRCAQVPQ